MKATIILSAVSAVAALDATIVPRAAASGSALHLTIVPRAAPTITSDPWQCATENLDQYFDVPKPTSSLLSAINSYASSIIKTCSKPSASASATSCPYPEQSKWCGFTTAAPTSVLSAYSTYGSTVSSWWFAHSSAAVSLARECPNGWYRAMLGTPGGTIG